MTEKYDLVVIGGGLGGMAAAFKSKGSRRKIALLDDSLPAAGGRLGGFAKFSGAKFSLLPAVAHSVLLLSCVLDVL